MEDCDLEIGIKVIVVGNGGVGKSSLMQRYCKGIFTDQYKKTIGVDFMEKQLDYNSTDVRLMLWDTAGQEEFDALTKSYYRGANACVLTFSTTDLESFQAISSWKSKVEEECSGIPMALVQNKVDLIEDSAMEPEEAESLAKKIKTKFFRTSVSENFNVDEVFTYLIEKHMELAQTRRILKETIAPSKKMSNFNNSNTPPGSAGSKYSRENISLQLQPSKRRTKNKKNCAIM